MFVSLNLRNENGSCVQNWQHHSWSFIANWYILYVFWHTTEKLVTLVFFSFFAVKRICKCYVHYINAIGEYTLVIFKNVFCLLNKMNSPWSRFHFLTTHPTSIGLHRMFELNVHFTACQIHARIISGMISSRKNPMEIYHHLHSWHQQPWHCQCKKMNGS